MSTKHTANDLPLKNPIFYCVWYYFCNVALSNSFNVTNNNTFLDFFLVLPELGNKPQYALTVFYLKHAFFLQRIKRKCMDTYFAPLRFSTIRKWAPFCIQFNNLQKPHKLQKWSYYLKNVSKM